MSKADQAEIQTKFRDMIDRYSRQKRRELAEDPQAARDKLERDILEAQKQFPPVPDEPGGWSIVFLRTSCLRIFLFDILTDRALFSARAFKITRSSRARRMAGMFGVDDNILPHSSQCISH
jgi:hypothetical protein